MLGRELQNDKSTSELCRSRIKLARISLMCFSIFSVINFVLALAKSSFAFAFSAFVPRYLLSFGNYALDKLGSDKHTAFFTAISALYVCISILCSSLTLRYSAYIIPSAVILLSDCLFMIIYFAVNYKLIMATNPIGMLLNMILHVICDFYCIFGVIAYNKLRKNNVKDMQQRG